MNIRKKILELNLTQKEFGEIVGADRMSLRNYDIGKAPEKMQKYIKLVFYTIEQEGLGRLIEILGE